MQQQENHCFQEILNSLNSTCIKNNKATFFCFNQKCQKYPMICGQKNCDCLKVEHMECDFTFMDGLIKKVIKKKGTLSQETGKVFQKVDNILLDSIDKLSQLRQSLLLWRQNYGLNPDEVMLIQTLKSNDCSKINGLLISRIKKKLSHQDQGPQLSHSSLQEINNYWETQGLNFQAIFKKLMQTIHIFKDQKGMKKFNFSVNLSNKPGKQMSFNMKNKIFERTESNLGVIQLTSLQPLPSKGRVYFDTEVIQSKGGYFATGIVTKKIKDDDQAFSNKESIKYFGHGNVWLNGDGQGSHQRIRDGQNIRTIVDLSKNTVEWQVNQKILRKVEMKQAFIGVELYVSYQLGSYTGIKFRKI